MKHALKMTALAVFAASFGTTALADDKASTKGGFQIKSEDGNFEAKIGGRIHVDGNYYVDEDDITAGGSDNSNSQFFLRRARLSLEGRAFDWTYKFENDFGNSSEEATSTTSRSTTVCSVSTGAAATPACPAGSVPVTITGLASASTANNTGIREMWVGRKVLGDMNLRLGQAKPYRGLEELTSSNEILFMERPFTTASGIYNRQFVTGAFLDGNGEGYGYGFSAYTPRAFSDSETQGLGVNARGFIVPVRTNGNLVHVGLSASQDNYETSTTEVRVRIVGRENGLRERISNFSANEQTTVALELAGRFGGAYFSSEYAKAKFENTNTTVEEDVDALTVQASYFLTNHTKPYDFQKGFFKSPKVDGEEGAIELKVRYDMIENKDNVASQKATYYALGVNYYATPNTRFLVEYADGTFENGTAADKDASVISGRIQYNF